MDDNSLTISNEALNLFRDMKDDIVRKSVKISMNESGSEDLLGDDAFDVLFNGIGITVDMVDNAMGISDISILEDQLNWAISRLPLDGINPGYIRDRLIVISGVIKEIMPEKISHEINAYFEWMIKKLEELPNE